MSDPLLDAGELIAVWLEAEAAARTGQPSLPTYRYRAAADGVRALVRRIAELEALLLRERTRNDND